MKQDFERFFLENAASEALIEYKKEEGMDGGTTLRLRGAGAMLFDGVCTILKCIAIAEAEQAENADLAMDYVELVRDMVAAELREEEDVRI